MLNKGVHMDKDQMPPEPDVNLNPQDVSVEPVVAPSTDVDLEAAQMPESDALQPETEADEPILPEPMSPEEAVAEPLSDNEPEVGVMDEPDEVAVVTAMSGTSQDSDLSKATADNGPAAAVLGEEPVDSTAEGTPVVAPIPVVATTQPEAAQQPPKKPRKKGLVIGLIIAAILVVLGGGLAAAYVLWYQAPQKITNDALGSLISADQMSYTAGLAVQEGSNEASTLTLQGRVNGNKATIAVSGAFATDGVSVPLSLSAVMPDDGSYYVQINNIGDIIDALAGDYADGYKLYFADTIAQVEGKWLKLTTDDLSSSNSEASTCEQQAIDAILADQKSLASDVMRLYDQYPAFVATEKLGARDIDGVASLGVSLSPSDENLKSLILAVQDLPQVKAYVDCDPENNAVTAEDIQSAIDESDSTTSEVIELWADRITHNLTEIKVTSQDGDTKATLTFVPKVGVEVEPIEAPASSTSIKELIDQLSQTFGE